MKILLNITAREAATFSGDVSFYRNLLPLGKEGLEFQLVKRRSGSREIRKLFERMNTKRWPPGVRRVLFRASRRTYIAPSDLRGVDLVLSHILFPRLAGHELPVIWSSQGIGPRFYYEATGPATQEDVVNLYNRFGNRAALLLVWTRSGATNIAALCSLEKPIVVLPPIVEVRPSVDTQGALAPKRASCQLLFVGRDPHRKGLFDLLKAYQRLLAKGVDAALDVVSRLTPAQVKDLQGIDGVTYYTGVPDSLIGALMERADVLVLPTHAETYGFVLVEAMARGCALVTSDYEPLNELVVSGENGFAVRPGDVDALENALTTLAEQPLLVRRFADNALRRYRAEFSRHVLTARYHAVFRHVLGEWRERRGLASESASRVVAHTCPERAEV